MTLPLGTIVRILEGCPDNKDVMLGGLKNLHQSLKDLPANYFSTDESKYTLLNPRSSAYDLCRKLKINIDDTEPLKCFICRSLYCTKEVTQEYSFCKFAKCRNCWNIMDREIYNYSTTNAQGGQVNGGVFVSEVTTFLVTDDLRVMPNTSDYWVHLLRDHGITNASQLHVMTLEIGREQILIILKGALLSDFSLSYLVYARTQFKWDLVGTLVQPLMKNEVWTYTKRMMLKVTLQKSTSKFLFAEAEDDFVDFVFGFLGISLGVVIGKLMNGTSSVVSLDNLFASLSSIGYQGKYSTFQDVKAMLCEPQLLLKYISKHQRFPLNVSNDPPLAFHFNSCDNDSVYFNYTFSSFSCNDVVHVSQLKDPRVEGSFIKAPAKFMLTDDLLVNPLSSFSTIAILDKFNVPLNDVESHGLSIGMEEGLELLKASLMPSMKCLSHLTNVLLRKTIATQPVLSNNPTPPVFFNSPTPPVFFNSSTPLVPPNYPTPSVLPNSATPLVFPNYPR